jgi:hypothetical protein
MNVCLHFHVSLRVRWCSSRRRQLNLHCNISHRTARQLRMAFVAYDPSTTQALVCDAVWRAWQHSSTQLRSASGETFALQYLLRIIHDFLMRANDVRIFWLELQNSLLQLLSLQGHPCEQSSINPSVHKQMTCTRSLGQGMSLFVRPHL